jgi:hypothetical protein
VDSEYLLLDGVGVFLTFKAFEPYIIAGFRSRVSISGKVAAAAIISMYSITDSTGEYIFEPILSYSHVTSS